MEIVFAKQDARRNVMEVQTLLLQKPVKKFATDKDEGVLWKEVFRKSVLRKSLPFSVSGIVFGEKQKLNSQYPYPVQFSRLICRRRKRNKTSVLYLAYSNSL